MHHHVAIGLGYGDAPVIAAVVGVEEELAVRIMVVLQNKFLVRPVDVEVHAVLAAHFHARQPGVALGVTHFQRHALPRLVHYYRCHFRAAHGHLTPKTSRTNFEQVRGNSQLSQYVD